jgi:hypothetical protein
MYLILIALSVLFGILKAAGVAFMASVSWWIVAAPLIVMAVLIVAGGTIVVVFALLLALAACGPTPSALPTGTPASAPVVGQPSGGGMDPLAAGAIGAAAGYMLGSAGKSTAPAPTVVHKTVVVKQTVNNRTVYRAPSRPSFSGRRR